MVFLNLEDKYRNYAQTAKNNKNRRKYWNENDDRRIIANNRPIDRLLSKELGRSVQSIQIRRCRILMLDEVPT